MSLEHAGDFFVPKVDFHNQKGALAVTGILPPVHTDTGIGNKIPFAQIVDGGGLCRQMKVEVAFQ